MMKIENIELEPFEKMKSSIKLTGILLIILGLLGIVLPQVLSMVIEIFFGLIMLAGGLMFGYYSYQIHSHSKSSINWLKPLLLTVGGILLLVYPSSGISAIILLLSFYFFTDAFASFALSYELYPADGWFWMTINGVLTAILAFLILIGWPETSMIYLGLFVGISLIFDGIALFMLAKTMEVE